MTKLNKEEKRGGKRIAITGGFGFIGSHICEELVKRGYEPVIIDNFIWPNDKRFDYSFKKFEQHYIDIRDFDGLFYALQNCAGVIHLAAILGTPETLKGFRAIRNTADVNVMGSLNVFEIVKELDIPCVYIQTGNGKNLSPYPITKDCAAEFALTYNKEFGTKITVIRGLVAYGERQKHYPVKKIMPAFMTSCLLNEPILINGNGEQKHDFIYVKDLATVLVDALFENTHFDRVIDGGSGYEYTVNEVAEIVKKAMGSDVEIQHTDPLPNGNVRMGEPANDAILSDASRHLVKQYNHRKMEDVIDQIAEWYKKVYSKALK